MELPNFIKKNKDKIIEIAKWSNKYYRESAIIQYLNNKIETLYSNASLYIVYPNESIKNILHIHPLPENKIGHDYIETRQITFSYALFNLFKTLQSGGDMKDAMQHDKESRNKNSSNSYVASLDNKNNILYIRNYSVSIVKNIDYNILAENISNTLSLFMQKFGKAYSTYYNQDLITKNIDEFHSVIINEMKNKKTTKKMKEYLDNNLILYTIKL